MPSAGRDAYAARRSRCSNSASSRSISQYDLPQRALSTRINASRSPAREAMSSAVTPGHWSRMADFICTQLPRSSRSGKGVVPHGRWKTSRRQWPRGRQMHLLKRTGFDARLEGAASRRFAPSMWARSGLRSIRRKSGFGCTPKCADRSEAAGSASWLHLPIDAAYPPRAMVEGRRGT